MNRDLKSTRTVAFRGVKNPARLAFSADAKVLAGIGGDELVIDDLDHPEQRVVIPANKMDYAVTSRSGKVVVLHRLARSLELFEGPAFDAPKQTLPFDLAIANLPSFLPRDLAPRLDEGVRLEALFGKALKTLTEQQGFFSLALSRDGALCALGFGEVLLVRTRDGKKLRLTGDMLGGPVWAAFDEEGHFEASKDATSFIELATPSSDPAADRASVLAAERPGLLRDFVVGAQRSQ